MLRILYCSENYCPHDHRFLSALAESAQHEIHWFRLEGGDRIQEERALPDKVICVQWPGMRKEQSWLDYPRLKNDFASVLDQIKPDVVHAGPVQRVALLAALNDFHPLVTMSWGYDMLQDAEQNLFWRLATRYVLRNSDWLIADCHTVKDKAAAFGYDSENVTIFPWGVDLRLFSPQSQADVRKAIGLTDQFLVIHTRSWEERYGVDIALRGFLEAVRTHPKMHMLMLGGGSQSQEVHRFVEENGLQDHVYFIGYLSNEKLAQYYQAGDVYLSASHVDGSSVALLEAMACGCVPIVSDIPSNLEWVQDEKTGWSFRDGSADHLANVLRKAYQTDLKDMRAAVRQKTEKDADWEIGKQRLLRTYLQVMANK
jgi:glycosyltransferase involved in cell wall biosynthesis